MNRAIAWFVHNAVAANLMMLVMVVGGAMIVAGIRQEEFPAIEPEAVQVTVQVTTSCAAMVGSAQTSPNTSSVTVTSLNTTLPVLVTTKVKTASEPTSSTGPVSTGAASPLISFSMLMPEFTPK